MNPYSQMRSHVTPVPTPPVVRLVSSALIGVAVAVLTTELARGVQVAVLVVALAAAFLLMFTHPYRRRMQEFLQRHGVQPRPRFGQVVPLFLVWLLLMFAPLLAPAALWVTVLVFAVAAGWMYWVFPHVDGSRALAFVG